MKRIRTRRWFAWLVLAALLFQAGLPTLRLSTAQAGELRAQAILATALCSKPAQSVADGIAALLDPWQQHNAKAKHHHCDSCRQSLDAPLTVEANASFVSLLFAVRNVVPDYFSVWFSPSRTLAPPSRGPPVFS
jgi:Protein of unknown function (DUF2946)